MGSVEYSFIGITPKSTQPESDCTHYDPINQICLKIISIRLKYLKPCKHVQTNDYGQIQKRESSVANWISSWTSTP